MTPPLRSTKRRKISADHPEQPRLVHTNHTSHVPNYYPAVDPNSATAIFRHVPALTPWDDDHSLIGGGLTYDDDSELLPLTPKVFAAGVPVDVDNGVDDRLVDRGTLSLEDGRKPPNKRTVGGFAAFQSTNTVFSVQEPFIDCVSILPPPPPPSLHYSPPKDCQPVFKNTDDVVGLDSKQMKIMKRLYVYLEENLVDQHVLAKAVEIADYCTSCHLSGKESFKHLPGAIFEHFVDILGAKVFYQCYQASKTFAHERVAALGLIESEPVASATDEPNIVQAAVATGYLLGRAESPVNLRRSLQQASLTVMDLDSAERRALWDRTLGQSGGAVKTTVADV